MMKGIVRATRRSSACDGEACCLWEQNWEVKRIWIINQFEAATSFRHHFVLNTIIYKSDDESGDSRDSIPAEFCTVLES